MLWTNAKMWKYAREPPLLILQWIDKLSTEKQAQKWLKEILLCYTLQHNPDINRNWVVAEGDSLGKIPE